ncbi:MAG: response regulator [Alphaproteobacteria bacterium]
MLALDNDEKTQTEVKNYLEKQGYIFIGKRYGEDFIKIFERIHPDLILLDIQLPDKDGISLITQIRSRTSSPILVISEKKTMMDKVVGLEVGADDYIGKPFEMRELAARIKAHLRLVKKVEQDVIADQENEGAKIIHFGHWYLDLNRHELLDENKKALDMTPGEIEMLTALTKSPRKALTHDQLFDLTRERDYEGFDRAVDVQISRIRQKIGDDKRKKPFIKTVRGIGYMLDTQTQIIE